MIINKIAYRIILRNKSQFIGIILLIIIASICYCAFSISLGEVERNFYKFIKNTNQEDAHIIVASSLDTDNANKYDITIEERLQYDYNYSDKTLRIFNIPSKINLPYIDKGKLPQKNEIIIDPLFAKANGYNIGDTINISNKSFTISGYFFLPDYIYIIKNEQDLLNDPKRFGIAMVNTADFKNIFPLSIHRYYMIKGSEENIKSFKQDISQKMFVLDFKKKDENPRILYVEMKMKSSKQIILPIAIFIILISSFLLFIITRRQLNILHAEIGTLYSLGYTKSELLKVYMRIPFIVWLWGSIIGTILGYILAIPMKSLFIEYFVVPLSIKSVAYKEIFISLFLPAFFILPSGYLVLNNMLSKSILSLIRGEGKAIKRKFGLKFKNLSFKNLVLFKNGFMHFSRELLLIFGIAFSTVLILYAFSAKSAVDNLTYETYQNIYKFNHMYVLNSPTDVKGNYEKALIATLTVKGTKSTVQIYGLEKDSQMINLYDKKKNKIDVDGFVISKALAMKLNLKKGDTITLVDQASKEYTLKINNIAEMYIGSQAFIERSTLISMMNLRDDFYNTLFSKDKLNIPDEKIFFHQDKQYLINSFENSSNVIKTSFATMSIFAALLSLIIIYVLSSLTISENKKPISLLKLLGFKNNEVFYMLLGFNNISFMIGFILGIPLFSWLSYALIFSATKNTDFTINLGLNINLILTGFVIVLITFIVSKYLGRLKIDKISPQEIIKDQME